MKKKTADDINYNNEGIDSLIEDTEDEDDDFEDDDYQAYLEAEKNNHANGVMSYDEFLQQNNDEIIDKVPEENIETQKETEVSEPESFSYSESGVDSSERGVLGILSLIGTWFSRLGVVIAIILIAYFLIVGNIKGLLLYLLFLVGAYFFGYYFMYFYFKFTEANDK